MNRKPKTTLAQLQKSKRRVGKALGGMRMLDAETVKRAFIQETVADVMEDVFNDVGIETAGAIAAFCGARAASSTQPSRRNAIAAKVKSRRAVSNKSRSVSKRLRSQSV